MRIPSASTVPVLAIPLLLLLGGVPGGVGSAWAQESRAGDGEEVTTTVAGSVVADDGPVDGAEVTLDGAATTVTGPGGAFRFDEVAPGRWELRVRALGHRPATRTVEVGEAPLTGVEIRLETSAIPVDPIVVTGTLRETRVSDSPVKVDVVSARLLQRNASSNLMESIGQVNGLYSQMDCAVCYTNSIRINGMEGPYTAVLIDGMPIMGALASVYGLNGIDPALIERLEILKGPQSTLYGTEAMGGVVNVRTKDPRFAPRLAVDASRTSLGENAVNVAVAGSGESVGGLLSGSLIHNDRFVDENGDGFSDLTMDTRLSLFGKGQLLRDGRTVAELTAKVYREDRFGGVEGWTADDRGSDSVYGESIRTDRVEVMGTARLPWEGLRAQASYAWHHQDSWYGDMPYLATQHVGFGQLLWDVRAGRDHDVLVGGTLRLESYDDDTPATTTAYRRAIPGVFVQDEWLLGQRWTVLTGLRLDHHEEHGAIASPRASVKWAPREGTAFRVNAGTGFRVVNLFTEDHAALTGARDVIIEDDLEPERSRSLTLNVNQVLELGGNPMMLDLDVFHTRFSNRIQPDYDVHPNQIVYGNLDGHAVSRGVAFAFNQNFLHLPLLYSAGVTIQDVSITDEGVTQKDFFSAEYQGVWTVSWTFGGRLTLDWTGNVIGPMRLPDYPEPFTRPTRSEPYAVHNLQATLKAGGGADLYLGVKNLADQTQGSPLIDPGNPFGEAFDTNYVWGRIVGRTLVAGVRWARGR